MPDTLSQNMTNAEAEYNYWCDQTAIVKKEKDDVLKALTSGSLAEAMTALCYAMDECQVYLSQTAGMLDILGASTDYLSAFQNTLAEGKNISDQDAQDFVTEIQNFYVDIGGTGGPCPSWLSPSDQAQLINQLNSIATAYGNASNETPPPATPVTVKTPMDLTPTIVKQGQTNWTKNNENNTDGTVDIDPNYLEVTQCYQEMSAQFTTLNQAASTQQKFWSNQNDSFESAVNNDINLINGVNSVAVSNSGKTG